MVGWDVKVKRFCTNCVFAKRAMERDWKEIVDEGERRNGEKLRMPKKL
jgi:hypothetical protein